MNITEIYKMKRFSLGIENMLCAIWIKILKKYFLKQEKEMKKEFV